MCLAIPARLVDYVDGEYFLLSPMHPGVQILVNVIL